MKKIYYILILLLLFSYSCEDVLDKAPLDIISEKVVFEDPTLAQAYINNIYSDLSFLNREGFGTAWVDPLTNLSDEGRNGRFYVPLFTQWKAGKLDENGGLLELWNYGTIRKTNEFLEKIEGAMSISDVQKSEMIAQVRFARAIVYFYMVKRYGGIPIITKPQSIDAPEEELFVSRDKEVDVYDFIINELNEIVNDLPESTEVGYPSKYAVIALKSRVAMYAASIAAWGEVKLNGLVGIPESEKQRFWQISYDASKDIIESGKFELYNKIADNKVENFRQLFLDESNSEVIFSWQLTGVNVGSSFDQMMSPFQYSGVWAGGNSAVYLEMVEEFENIDGTPGIFDVELATSQPWDLREFFASKDPRFHASVNYEGVMWKGEPIEYWGGLIKPDGTKITSGSYNGISAKGRSYFGGNAGGAITGFLVHKYLDETMIPVESAKSKIDFIVFRLGEILLNYSEAAFELGKQDEALWAVNRLRDRAGIAQLTEITREKIRNERKVELAFEGHRYWDLKRWRIAVDAINRTFRGIYTFYDVNTGKFNIEINNDADEGAPAVFKEKHYYFPITPSRISNNPNLAPENPGYE